MTLEVVGAGGVLYGWLEVPPQAVVRGAVRPGGVVHFVNAGFVPIRREWLDGPWPTQPLVEEITLAICQWANDGAQPRLVFAATELSVDVFAGVRGFNPAPEGCWQ